MDPCNASDLLCVNISGQLFIIECVDFFSINLRGAAVCAMKTLLSCFSHFWASCKMLLHLLCLHCSAALNCTAAQCSKHTSAPGHLTWMLLVLVLLHFANFGTFWLRPNSSSILLRWEIWPKFFAPDNFQIPPFVLSPIHNDGLRQPHCQNRKNVMQSSLTFYNKQIQK